LSATVGGDYPLLIDLERRHDRAHDILWPEPHISLCEKTAGE
jgi:hypothetical protein